MSLKLNVITCSTRPTRVGPAVTKWFVDYAQQESSDVFDVENVDLASFNLPIFDEPKHPRFGEYEHAHTKAWSASVDSADAFVFVTPEYNHGPLPSFVNYGGVSGGLRGVHVAKTILTTMKVVPLLEAVPIPMVGENLKDGVFEAKEIHEVSAKMLLLELAKWAEALRTMRG